MFMSLICRVRCCVDQAIRFHGAALRLALHDIAEHYGREFKPADKAYQAAGHAKNALYEDDTAALTTPTEG
jgi:hypothetical protein